MSYVHESIRPETESTMALSRRKFMQSASAVGLGAFAAPLISGRGNEAFAAAMSEPGFYPGMAPTALSAVEERLAYRSKFKAGIRLDSNENPNGPGKAALEAVRGMFTESNRYPDDTEGELAAAIAKHQAVATQNVLMACGSGEILRSACYAYTGPGKHLVMGSPTFETPGGFAESMGARVERVPVDKQLRLDLDQMLDKATGAGLIFFCNPNNPTATVWGQSDVNNFIAQVNKRSPNTMILMDEAYHEYVEDPNYKTSIPVSMNNPKVFTVRTFSKVFGMAGLRAGYAIGRPEALAPMAKHKLSSGVNVLAAACGIATLPDQGHINSEIKVNRDAKAFTVKAFEQLGFKPSASQANFIMVPIGRDSRAFKDACAKQGVLVGRPFPPLTTHARISIGTMDEMKKAVEVFKSVLSSAADR
jgi:histidinol-phosphate aminotransferase